MNQNEISAVLRATLVPKGSADVVRLFSEGYYNLDFIKGCLNDLDKLKIKIVLGDSVSNLEKLAIWVLMQSAHIDPRSLP